MPLITNASRTHLTLHSTYYFASDTHTTTTTTLQPLTGLSWGALADDIDPLFVPPQTQWQVPTELLLLALRTLRLLSVHACVVTA